MNTLNETSDPAWPANFSRTYWAPKLKEVENTLDFNWGGTFYELQQGKSAPDFQLYGSMATLGQQVDQTDPRHMDFQNASFSEIAGKLKTALSADSAYYHSSDGSKQYFTGHPLYEGPKLPENAARWDHKFLSKKPPYTANCCAKNCGPGTVYNG